MYLALENIRSLYNVGAIFRTMSFFKITQVLLVGYSGRKTMGVNELHAKVKKTALGAEKDLDIKWLKNPQGLIKFSQKNKLKLVAIEQDRKSIKLADWQPEKNSVLVFGNEITGVSQEVLQAAKEIIEIPCLGKKRSLNVSVAAGIVLNQLSLFPVEANH